ncbi:hypothetical protein K1719_012178 [Acacia pycnantha]|nr:hypothetical protein K1719_012178 [Acacia pycnantha]
MLRREVLDSFLRSRAQSASSNLIAGLISNLEVPTSPISPYIVYYTAKNNTRLSIVVNVVISADGANSRVAKSMDAGSYTCAIAFQERIKLPDEKMEYYDNLAEM